MRNLRKLFFIVLLLPVSILYSQTKDSVIIAAIVKEATENSQLEKLGHELMDGIGPRLVGTPQMKQAHDWAIAKYDGWGITARNEKWGEWRGWERGISHIDMVYPRVKTLEGMQLAWSPGTKGKTVTAEMIILADAADSIAFQQWLPEVKRKICNDLYEPANRETGIQLGRIWYQRIGRENEKRKNRANGCLAQTHQ